MLVVEKNGQTTIVSGWRAWILALGVVLGVVAVITLMSFVFIGIALTIGAVLLIAVPIVHRLRHRRLFVWTPTLRRAGMLAPNRANPAPAKAGEGNAPA